MVGEIDADCLDRNAEFLLFWARRRRCLSSRRFVAAGLRMRTCFIEEDRSRLRRDREIAISSRASARREHARSGSSPS